MSNAVLLDRISVKAEICNGKPTVAGTRIAVQSVLEYLAAGDSINDVLTSFPGLQKDDVLACLLFASRLANGQIETIKAT